MNSCMPAGSRSMSPNCAATSRRSGWRRSARHCWREFRQLDARAPARESWSPASPIPIGASWCAISACTSAFAAMCSRAMPRRSRRRSSGSGCWRQISRWRARRRRSPTRCRPRPAECEYENPAARAIIASLMSGIRSLADIPSGFAPSRSGRQHAGLVRRRRCAAGRDDPGCGRSANRALRRRLGRSEEIPAIALPCGTALDIDHGAARAAAAAAIMPAGPARRGASSWHCTGCRPRVHRPAASRRRSCRAISQPASATMHERRRRETPSRAR